MNKSTLEKYIWKIYPLFKSINLIDLKKRVYEGEEHMGKVREIVGLSAPMHKIGYLTYLSKYKEPWKDTETDIEGGNSLSL